MPRPASGYSRRVRESAILIVGSHDTPWAVIREIFLRAGLADMAKRGPQPFGVYTLKLAVGSAELEALKSALRAQGLTWSERLERRYTDVELRRFPLLNLVVRRAEKGLGGPAYGTEYDLTGACPVCGTGAIQTSPLYLKRSDIPTKAEMFQTLDHEFLVSTPVADALRSGDVTGLELRQARAARTREALPWWQILATFELPPMHESSEGIETERPCRMCHRSGFFVNPNGFELAYESDAVAQDAVPDVNWTYERFGNGALREPLTGSSFASPKLIVKPRVLDILRKAGVRFLEFAPVRVVEKGR
jgi:hypothetical protein